MVTLGRLVFKATGVMSNRGLLKNSHQIGQRIAETMKHSGENINVKRIIQDTVGEKAARKIQFIDRETFVRRAMDTGGVSRSELEQALNVADGITLFNKYGRGADIFLREGTDNGEIAGIIAHELEHALNYSFGKMSVPKGFLGKFSWGRKYLDKAVARQKELGFQGKYQDMYEKLLGNLKTGKRFDINSVRDLLYSKGILQVGKDKENRLILKMLRTSYEDEARAYTVQAETTRAMGHAGKVYDMVANEFNTLTKGVAQEAKNIRTNRIRSFFGMKPKIHMQSVVPKAEPAQFVKATETTAAAKNVFKT